jgi:hypothetical protein
MSRNELIEHSRESAKNLHAMQVQMKRLEQHQQNMSTVGSNTDSEFRQLFQELYSEIRNKMEKHDNKICYWDNCNVDSEFDTPDLIINEAC